MSNRFVEITFKTFNRRIVPAVFYDILSTTAQTYVVLRMAT